VQSKKVVALIGTKQRRVVRSVCETSQRLCRSLDGNDLTEETVFGSKIVHDITSLDNHRLATKVIQGGHGRAPSYKNAMRDKRMGRREVHETTACFCAKHAQEHVDPALLQRSPDIAPGTEDDANA
jgi:hypothetical protein